jgi:uncharacterized protein (DUF2267 family)
MATAGSDSFNHALHTANIWLADIGSAFGTRDRRYSQRMLRTWLHALRDRLTVDAAAKFAQQLPELLRGSYYDGWEPNRVPIKYNVDQYVARFADQAGVPADQVPAAARTISAVIANHMSPGQLAEALAELPAALRHAITDAAAAQRPETTAGTGAMPAAPASPDQVAAIEGRVNALTEAVRTLAHGLEDGQLTGSGIDPTRVIRAARLADEILIAAGTRAA